MFKGGFVFDEFTLEGRFKQPVSDRSLSGFNIAKVDSKGGGNVLSVELGTDDIEVNQ